MIGRVDESEEDGVEEDLGVVGNKGLISGDNAEEVEGEESGEFEYGNTLGSAAIVESLIL
ncbi:Ribose-phosphate pyrophosphokinase [Bienertia sinuspersici]